MVLSPGRRDVDIAHDDRGYRRIGLGAGDERMPADRPLRGGLTDASLLGRSPKSEMLTRGENLRFGCLTVPLLASARACHE
jgi:hypothetical protein